MTENKIYTNWTKATTDPTEAMLKLVSCIESGKNAWIEIRENGDQTYPIKKKNPLLDNPFNWTMDFGVVRSEKELNEHKFFNKTEEDLMRNWIACFGDQAAIDEYQKNGTITKGLIFGIGICHPVRIQDADQYRAMFTGDGYKHGYWMTYWKPKDNIPFWVVDKNISKAFTVCYTDEPVEKTVAIRRAAEYLLAYVDQIEEQQKN